MNTARTDFTPLAVLAQLLDRLDASATSADPLQYRLLAQRVTQLLHDLQFKAEAQDGLQGLLRSSPALTLLYENLHYAEAGLCRAPLAQSVAAEVQTRQLLGRLAQGRAAPGAHQPDARPEPGTPA